jgi:hypothetical protein
VCKHRDKTDRDDPCSKCGHNLNVDRANDRAGGLPGPPVYTDVQVERGMIVGYLTLLLHTWRKPVEQGDVESALIIMANDDIRSALLGKAVRFAPDRKVFAPVDFAGLEASGVVRLTTTGGRRIVQLGPRALELAQFPKADQSKAQEAIRAFETMENIRED